jgi:hypothetical protein
MENDRPVISAATASLIALMRYCFANHGTAAGMTAAAGTYPAYTFSSHITNNILLSFQTHPHNFSTITIKQQNHDDLNNRNKSKANLRQEIYLCQEI